MKVSTYGTQFIPNLTTRVHIRDCLPSIPFDRWFLSMLLTIEIGRDTSGKEALGSHGQRTSQVDWI